LHPSVQIILFGNEAGIAEAAARFDTEHVPDVKVNVHGTPLLDDAFRTARRLSRWDKLCYSNADIIFFSDLVSVAEAVNLPRFVMVGRRIDTDVNDVLDTSSADWERELRTRALVTGRLHEPTGIDYFLFPKGEFEGLLPFPVGRPLWDNWMIHHARAQGIPVIDATVQVMAIHQNHGYGHVQGPRAKAYEDEIATNWRAVGPNFLPLTIADATWVFDREGLRPARDGAHMMRRLLVAPSLSKNFKFVVGTTRRIARRARTVVGHG
jgi:hypothetical protein